jgi:radical SAM superfamily enzyme YgiQ (UPF0313 family)
MDILLTHGYFLSEDPHEAEIMKPYPPLGTIYLSSYLKERGFDVGVFDTTFREPRAFYQLIERLRPSVVGIYANLTTRRTVLRMARFCQDRGCTVIVGGPEPANYPVHYLTRGADVVIIGEGERTLEELLPHLARTGPKGMRHIRGIVYRDADGKLVRTEPRPFVEDLDTLPFPDRAAIDTNTYLTVWRKHHGRSSVSLITARGCPYRCAWCSHAVFGYSHRRRSPENVADEVELILETYQPDMLWYADDVFTIDKRWLEAYAAELQRRNIHIPFEATSREDRLDEDVARTLAEMGCFRLWIGAESGSQRILDAMARRVDAKRVPEVVRSLRYHGIEVGTFVMLGYEGEEISDLMTTADMLQNAKPDRFLTVVAYPIKGTPYYECVRERIVAPASWEETTDRDLKIAGRPSDRFYRFATRWMVNRVSWRRQWEEGPRDYARMLKAYLSAQVGRMGMRLTRHEVERG